MRGTIKILLLAAAGPLFYWPRRTLAPLVGAAVAAMLFSWPVDSILHRAGYSGFALVGAASACDRACSDPDSRYVVSKTGNHYVAGDGWRSYQHGRFTVRVKVLRGREAAKAHAELHRRIKRITAEIALEERAQERTLLGFAADLDQKAVGVYSQLTSCLPASLKARIHEIERRWGKVRVVSTFRRGGVIAGSGSPSLHAACRAIDFHPPRGTHSEVARWLKATHPGGVGTYSGRMHHIHIDNGRRSRWHHRV